MKDVAKQTSEIKAVTVIDQTGTPRLLMTPSLGWARPSFDKAKSIRELTYKPLLAHERT